MWCREYSGGHEYGCDRSGGVVDLLAKREGDVKDETEIFRRSW